MTFIDTLKSGEIPAKNPKNRRNLTPYDRFAERKKNLLKEETPTDVKCIKPRSFADMKSLLDCLKAQSGLVVDFEGLPFEDAQRMLDYLSGAVYVLNGGIERINNLVFLVTPKGITIKNQ